MEHKNEGKGGKFVSSAIPGNIAILVNTASSLNPVFVRVTRYENPKRGHDVSARRGCGPR